MSVKLQNSPSGPKWRLKYDVIGWYSNQVYAYFAEHDDKDPSIITEIKYSSTPNRDYTSNITFSDGSRIDYKMRSSFNMQLYAPIVGCKLLNPITGESIIATSTNDYISRGTSQYYGSMYIFYPS